MSNVKKNIQVIKQLVLDQQKYTNVYTFTQQIPYYINILKRVM